MICGCISAGWYPPVDDQKSGSGRCFCVACGAPLEPDEIALTKKMINRGAREFFCLPCLAAHFDVPQEALRQKIIQFREMGCTLFTRQGV